MQMQGLRNDYEIRSVVREAREERIPFRVNCQILSTQ